MWLQTEAAKTILIYFATIVVNSQKFPTERGIDDLADNLYHAYFGMKLGDHDQSWTPHIVCKTCLEHSRQWENDKRNSLRFGVLVIWLEPQNIKMIVTSVHLIQ